MDEGEKSFMSVFTNFTKTYSVNVAMGEDTWLMRYIRTFVNLKDDWLLSLISAMLYGIGFFANLLLLIYLIKYKRYRSPIFTLILSMCIADTIMCAIAIIWVTLRAPFVLGPLWLCELCVEVQYASLVASAYHLVVISLVRFYQLVFPLPARANITPSLMCRICIGVWLFSIASCIPFAVFTTATSAEYEGVVYTVCVWVGGYVVVHNLYIGIVKLLIPFTITAVFHIAKHCVVMNARIRSNNSVAEERQKRETTDSRAIMIVIAVYLLTAAPITVINFLLMPIPRLIVDLSIKILWLSSTLNPFIYAFAAQSVRHDVMRMVACSGSVQGAVT